MLEMLSCNWRRIFGSIQFWGTS